MRSTLFTVKTAIYLYICVYIVHMVARSGRSNPIRVAIASCALDTTIRTETLNREGELTLFPMEIWFYDCTVAVAFAFAFCLCFLLCFYFLTHTPARTYVCTYIYTCWFLAFCISCRNLINTYRIDEILPVGCLCTSCYDFAFIFRFAWQGGVSLSAFLQLNNFPLTLERELFGWHCAFGDVRMLHFLGLFLGTVIS